jgi:hypothetical protein
MVDFSLFGVQALEAYACSFFYEPVGNEALQKQRQLDNPSMRA